MKQLHLLELTYIPPQHLHLISTITQISSSGVENTHTDRALGASLQHALDISPLLLCK